MRVVLKWINRFSRESHPQMNHYTWESFVKVLYLPLFIELMLRLMLLIIIMVYYELVEFALGPNFLDAQHVILQRIEVVGPPDA